MKTTTEIKVGSAVVIVDSRVYRGMHGTVVDISYGLATVALVEAAGTHLAISVDALAAA